MVMGVIMVYRAFQPLIDGACLSFTQLGLIQTLADSTVKILTTTSFAIMALDPLIGALPVLKASAGEQGRETPPRGRTGSMGK